MFQWTRKEWPVLFMRAVSILEGEDNMAKLGVTLGNPWGPRGAGYAHRTVHYRFGFKKP